MVVRSFDREPRCTRCNLNGHWTVSCPTKDSEILDAACDDALVKSMFCIPGEEPEEQVKFVEQLWRKWGLKP